MTARGLHDGLADLWRFLRTELANQPGRLAFATRLTVVSLIAVVISMTLEVPFVTLSVAAVLFSIMQPNVVLSRMVGIVFLVSNVLETAVLLLVLKVSYDHPALRIILSSSIFFVCMYLMRAHKLGVVFFAVGAVLMIGQTEADTIEFPDLAVRLQLWIGVACTYPIALMWIVNVILFPVEPVDQLRAEIGRQLSPLVRRLEGAVSPDARDLSPAKIEQSMAALQKLHGLTCARDASYGKAKAYWSACIDTVSYLCFRLGHLPLGNDRSQEARGMLARLGEQVALLQSSFSTGEPYRSTWMASANEMAVARTLGVEGPCLMLQRLSAMDKDVALAAAPPKGGMLVPDALTNPAYVRFAFKALLASLICYVFYHGADWDGIHTSMITCALVANPNMGATSQKLILRFGGAFLGGALALVLSLTLLLRVDGIVGLLLLIAPVFFAGAWIAGGSERSGYIGVQMVATFCIATLEHFHPVVDLVEIRDRAVGILVGTLVCALVYTFLWPESEAGKMRRDLANLVRQIGKLIARPLQQQQSDPLGYLHEWAAGVSAIHACEELRERVALEGNLHGDEREALLQRTDQTLAQGRYMLRDWDALQETFIAADSPHADGALSGWQEAIRVRLDHYADGVDASTNDGGAVFNASSVQEVHVYLPGIHAERLMGDIDGLPDWTAATSGDFAHTAVRQS